MTLAPIHNPNLSVGTTSDRWVVGVADADYIRVHAEQKSTAWGTAVLAVKYGFSAEGPFNEFIPQIRIGPPATANTPVVSPMLDVRTAPYIEVSVTTAESGEFVRLWVGRWSGA